MDENILVVDDDEVFRERLCRALTDRGYNVCGAASVLQARECILDFAPTKAVLDLRMPGESGLILVSELRERFAELKIVVLTGYGSIATAVEAMKRGASNYLTKPVTITMLLESFDRNRVEDGNSVPNGGVQTLDDVEWEHIQRVYLECKENVSLTAKTLGMHRRSLQRKLARLT